MEAKVKVGDRVVKGPTWKWAEQGGAFPSGKVEGVGEVYGDNDHVWAQVQWDNGDRDSYRMGGEYADLIVVGAHTQHPDVVNKPSHYARFAIEPIEFILKNDLPFHKGNPIKYIARAGYKLYPEMDAEQSEVTDLKKAKRMIEMRLNQLAGEETL